MAADGEAEWANASEGQCEKHDEQAVVNYAKPENRAQARSVLPLAEAASGAAGGKAEWANASEGQCEKHDERAVVNYGKPDAAPPPKSVAGKWMGGL